VYLMERTRPDGFARLAEYGSESPFVEALDCVLLFDPACAGRWSKRRRRRKLGGKPASGRGSRSDTGTQVIEPALVWTTSLDPKIPTAPWSRRESIRSEPANPRSEASPSPLERRTTARARQMHQSPVSLSRAGLCEWSRRESNPSPPPLASPILSSGYPISYGAKSQITVTRTVTPQLVDGAEGASDVLLSTGPGGLTSVT
jgi:hypothetical protein